MMASYETQLLSRLAEQFSITRNSEGNIVKIKLKKNDECADVLLEIAEWSGIHEYDDEEEE
jgi:hypothetical protein